MCATADTQAYGAGPSRLRVGDLFCAPFHEAIGTSLTSDSDPRFKPKHSVLVLVFEDLQADLASHLPLIARFLEVEVTASILEVGIMGIAARETHTQCR